MFFNQSGDISLANAPSLPHQMRKKKGIGENDDDDDDKAHVCVNLFKNSDHVLFFARKSTELL